MVASGNKERRLSQGDWVKTTQLRTASLAELQSGLPPEELCLITEKLVGTYSPRQLGDNAKVAALGASVRLGHTFNGDIREFAPQNGDGTWRITIDDPGLIARFEKRFGDHLDIRHDNKTLPSMASYREAINRAQWNMVEVPGQPPGMVGVFTNEADAVHSVRLLKALQFQGLPSEANVREPDSAGEHCVYLPPRAADRFVRLYPETGLDAHDREQQNGKNTGGRGGR